MSFRVSLLVVDERAAASLGVPHIATCPDLMPSVQLNRRDLRARGKQPGHEAMHIRRMKDPGDQQNIDTSVSRMIGHRAYIRVHHCFRPLIDPPRPMEPEGVNVDPLNEIRPGLGKLHQAPGGRGLANTRGSAQKHHAHWATVRGSNDRDHQLNGAGTVDERHRLDRPGEAQPCRAGLPGQRAVVLLASPDAACVHVVDPDAGQSGAERVPARARPIPASAATGAASCRRYRSSRVPSRSRAFLRVPTRHYPTPRGTRNAADTTLVRVDNGGSRHARGYGRTGPQAGPAARAPRRVSRGPGGSGRRAEPEFAGACRASAEMRIAAAEPVGELPLLGRVNVQPVRLAGRDPSDAARLIAGRGHSADRGASEDDLELLAVRVGARAREEFRAAIKRQVRVREMAAAGLAARTVVR